jgi:NADH-quinone oxidoreductase subunit N
VSWNGVPAQRGAEHHACLLLLTAGLNLVGLANDLIGLFLALELISIPTYALLYTYRTDARAQEASLKYFLLSIFSSALLLYGFSLLYGVSGATNFNQISKVLMEVDLKSWQLVLITSLVMIIAGLSFRITAAPFHFYAPDVYQGTDTFSASLLSFVPKLAGFWALYLLAIDVILSNLNQGGKERLEAVMPLIGGFSFLCWIMAIVSMFLGNLMALLQENLRRMMAYSGVAHAGYMLIALGVGDRGTQALWFYLVIYGLMTLGVFAGLLYLGTRDRPVEHVDDLSGLARSHPMIALLLAICLFSLTGMPATAGFFAKFNLFLAAWGSGLYHYQLIAVLLAVNAAIAAWYYLRIVGVMYLRQPIKPLAPEPNAPGLAGLVICSLLCVLLFLAPSTLWNQVAPRHQGPSQEAFETPLAHP